MPPKQTTLFASQPVPKRKRSGYETWSKEELRQQCELRGITSTGTGTNYLSKKKRRERCREIDEAERASAQQADQACMKFFSQLHGDEDMVGWLEQDVTYTSSTSLTELLECITTVLKDDLTQDVSASPFWSLSADSTRDVTRSEQLVVCVRFLKDHEIREVPVHIGSLDKVDAASYTDQIVRSVASFPAERLCGVAFDGATVMRGDYSGAQVQIRGMLQGTALFVWCYAHVLNLAAIDAAEFHRCVKLKEFFGILRSLLGFRLQLSQQSRGLPAEATTNGRSVRLLQSSPCRACINKMAVTWKLCPCGKERTCSTHRHNGRTGKRAGQARCCASSQHPHRSSILRLSALG